MDYQLPDSPMEREADRFMQAHVAKVRNTRELDTEFDMRNFVLVYQSRYAAFFHDNWKVTARAKLCVARIFKDQLASGLSTFADYILPETRYTAWILARLTSNELHALSVVTESSGSIGSQGPVFSREIARRQSLNDSRLEMDGDDEDDNVRRQYTHWEKCADEAVEVELAKTAPEDRYATIDDMKALYLSTARSSGYDDPILAKTNVQASQKLVLRADLCITRIVYFHMGTPFMYIPLIVSILVASDASVVPWGLCRLTTGELNKILTYIGGDRDRRHAKFKVFGSFVDQELELRNPPTATTKQIQPPLPVQPTPRSRTEEQRKRYALQIRSISGVSSSHQTFTIAPPPRRPFVAEPTINSFEATPVTIDDAADTVDCNAATTTTTTTTTTNRFDELVASEYKVYVHRYETDVFKHDGKMLTPAQFKRYVELVQLRANGNDKDGDDANPLVTAEAIADRAILAASSWFESDVLKSYMNMPVEVHYRDYCARFVSGHAKLCVVEGKTYTKHIFPLLTLVQFTRYIYINDSGMMEQSARNDKDVFVMFDFVGENEPMVLRDTSDASIFYAARWFHLRYDGPENSHFIRPVGFDLVPWKNTMRSCALHNPVFVCELTRADGGDGGGGGGGEGGGGGGVDVFYKANIIIRCGGVGVCIGQLTFAQRQTNLYLQSVHKTEVLKLWVSATFHQLNMHGFLLSIMYNIVDHLCPVGEAREKMRIYLIGTSPKTTQDAKLFHFLRALGFAYGESANMETNGYLQTTVSNFILRRSSRLQIIQPTLEFE